MKCKYFSLAFGSEDIESRKVAKNGRRSGTMYANKCADTSTNKRSDEYAND